MTEVGNMNCKSFDKYLDEYLSRTLTSAKRSAFEEHAEKCNHCGRILEAALDSCRKLKTEFAPKDPGDNHSVEALITQLESSQSGKTSSMQPFEGNRMRRVIIILAILLFMALTAATVFAHEYYNLLERLGDKDEGVRSAAAVELSENVWDTQVYGILIEALDSESPEVRAAAAESLGMIVNKSKGLSTKLLDMLSDKDVRVRIQANESLRKVGFLPESVPVLMEKLAGMDTFVQSMISYTISDVVRTNAIWMDQLVATLIDASKSDSQISRMNALQGLGRIGPQPGVVDTLMENLWADDFNLRSAAAMALGNLGEEGKIAIPRLIEMLTEERPNLPLTDEDGRQLYQADPYNSYLGNVAFILSMFGPDAKDALPVLIELYKTGDDSSPPPFPHTPFNENGRTVVGTKRIGAIQALGNIGIASDEVVSILIDALRDDDFGMRRTAVRAIRHLGPGGIKALPDLLEAMHDEDDFTNMAAAFAVQKLGPAAREAVPMLIDMLLNGEDDKLRANAILALREMGSEPGVIPALIKAMDDEDEDVRYSVIRAFKTIGTDDKDVVAAIFVKLNDESNRVREVAASVLAESGKHFEPALKVLIELLDDVDVSASSAAYTLGNIGPKAKRALPKLREIIDEHPDNDFFYANLLYAAANISGDAEEPLSMLISILNDYGSKARLATIQNIGKLGPGAKDAVGTLIATLSTGDSQIRKACASALGSIGPDAASALPILRALAEKDSVQDVRDAAGEAILKIEGEA